MGNSCTSSEPTFSSLIVKTTTWERDSHGLFDYDSKLYNKSLFKINGSCKLKRDLHTVSVVSPLDIRDSPTDPMSEYLLSIVYHK